ncbi:unnamed protein product [Sphagnum jensenii]|uniref:Uncharacterized protein n=1 Tax=Sphagnum jensenii TaxID=128206 RepID=A0ABP1ANA1_9BRYO
MRHERTLCISLGKDCRQRSLIWQMPEPFAVGWSQMCNLRMTAVDERDHLYSAVGSSNDYKIRFSVIALECCVLFGLGGILAIGMMSYSSVQCALCRANHL